jgi:uncharacterized protein (DUF1501 family)
MKRRDFVKSLSLGSLGMMLGQGLSMQMAYAAGELDPTRKFIFVYFSGAWDILLGLDPRDPDVFTDAVKGETGIQPAWDLIASRGQGFQLGLVQADGTPYVLGPSMASMVPHFDVCSVIRGISMDTVTHEVGRRYFLTGMMPRGLNASGSSMGTRVVAQQGDRTAIPNLVCRSESYNEGLPIFANALSVGSVADLVSALEEGPEAPPSDGAVRQALNTFRSQQNGFCDPSLFNRFGMLDAVRSSTIKARDLVEGSGQGMGLGDLFNFRLSQHDELRQRYGFGGYQTDSAGARAAMAFQALKYGISQSVTFSAALGLDTHDDNWSLDHPGLQQGGWDLVATLLSDLKATDDPDVVGKKLIDTTTVVCFSEFSRTPLLNNRDGRDHAIVNACLLAGAGVPQNKYFGGTSEVGMNAMPVNPQTGEAASTGLTLTPNNILASVLANAGLDTEKMRHDGLPFLRA